MLDPFCCVHSFDGVAMLSHLSTSQVSATTRPPIRGMSTHSNAPTPPLPALYDPSTHLAEDSSPAKPWQQRT